MVRSGIWGTLSEAAHCIAPVLLEMSERIEAASEQFGLQISYVGITRFSGVKSHRAIRKSLVALDEIGFLQLPCATVRRSPERKSSCYIITPSSDKLTESCNAFAAQIRTEISAEKELRKRARAARILKMRGAAKTSRRAECTKYKSLYPTASKTQGIAIPRIASVCTRDRFHFAGPSSSRCRGADLLARGSGHRRLG